MLNTVLRSLLCIFILGELIISNSHAQVVINEIHCDPDLKTEWVEFVELHNDGLEDIDLSGWRLSKGISYHFVSGTVLPAGGFVIVAQDPYSLHLKWDGGRNPLNPNHILGPFDGKLKNEGEKITLRNAFNQVVDQVDYQMGFPWPTVGDSIPPDSSGRGHSMQLTNPQLDNDLAGSWRSAYPTPLQVNLEVFAVNSPPHIRQVKHQPQQVQSGQPVTISAKVTDSDGVANVMLHLQGVRPGHYISIHDPEYHSNWIRMEMVDDGQNGDLAAGDNVYTATIPGALQVHRYLVRYQITVTDTAGSDLHVPYPDDPQPNFAYFIYDGVPSWSGAIQPGSSHPVKGKSVAYDEDIMRSLPVYHLISKAGDVEDCQFKPIPDARCNPQASLYQWAGTLVYDGVVYDHIRYRARGGGGTYSFGKNRWKFDFNRGHYFQAQDDYGKKYESTWDKLNFSGCFQFDGTHNRGEHGMYEVATAKLMALAGVPVSNTNWLQFRVIDDAAEFNPVNQYQGDLWGLYLAIEQPDGRFLKARDLPDGNLYKMYFACGDNPTNMNNQGPAQVTDHSDVQTFWNAYRQYPSDRQWWQDNTNLPLYYSYRLICDAVHHYDLSDGWNIFYYHHPDTSRWWAIPWDFDHSWDTDIYTHDDEYWKQVLKRDFFQRHPVAHPSTYHAFPDCIIDFQNRARELQDLLINQDQCVQLLNACANIISDPNGGPSFVDVDRAMWDHHPRTRAKGTFYESSPTGDFAGMMQRMRTFVSPGGWGYENIAHIEMDVDAPHTPIIEYTGPVNFPGHALTFAASASSDAQGSSRFNARQWRIAEVELDSIVPTPSAIDENSTVFVAENEAYQVFKGVQEPSGAAGLWRQLDFDDSHWLTGDAPIGYGETFIETELADMRGHYSTLYLRKTFEVSSLEEIEVLALGVRFDDGVNIWINGQHVFRGNLSSNDLPFNATTASRPENHEFTSITIQDAHTLLKVGMNVIAVQVVNQSRSNSSDCFIDVRLAGKQSSEEPVPKPSPTPLAQGTPIHLEIDTLWEYLVFDASERHIVVPVDIVQPEHTYRVRCRVQDSTGRWSHWSSPVQFEVGEASSLGAAAHLGTTKKVYNPVD